MEFDKRDFNAHKLKMYEEVRKSMTRKNTILRASFPQYSVTRGNEVSSPAISISWDLNSQKLDYIQPLALR